MAAFRRRRCPALRSSCSWRECSRPHRRCSARDTRPSLRGPVPERYVVVQRQNSGRGIHGHPPPEFLDTHRLSGISGHPIIPRGSVFQDTHQPGATLRPRPRAGNFWTPAIREFLWNSCTPIIRRRVRRQFLDTHHPGLEFPGEDFLNLWTPAGPQRPVFQGTHQPAATLPPQARGRQAGLFVPPLAETASAAGDPSALSHDARYRYAPVRPALRVSRKPADPAFTAKSRTSPCRRRCR
jgi:hypothetical protein